ncbi:hypothetical protein H5V45_07470 [Nocardioides sp. KIGAM211]|uniref:Uncharacterized protein n=1 Tax=Nocardioides luti TaxID=2761101 RepID=A0A7X0RHJ8_9ACTN|nr:hypothetical protein [Nocardioides luti]MBB6627158.1 hypothetical protein [Nocardioides luti]
MAAVVAADEAEARGDALGALRIIDELARQLPASAAFWRPWRVRRLLQLTTLGPVLPRWVTSRWILAQALQHLSPTGSAAARSRHRRALDLAIALRGGPGTLPGVDEADRMARVMDHDWVYRQLFLYELGGLAAFLRSGASADLVAGADQIQAWAAAPMGGYRLLETSTFGDLWIDLGDREVRVTPNIGSSSLVVPGECVVGRLVPTYGGTMFEAAPLFVPDDVARAVAADPAGWYDALRAVPDGTDSPTCRPAGDLQGLVSDVPSAVLGAWLADVAEVPARERDVPHVLARGALDLAHQLLDPVAELWDDASTEGERQEAVDDLMRRAREAEGDLIDPWSVIGALLLSPDAVRGMATAMLPSDVPLLERLGELLAEPAAEWCRVLAEELPEAA